MPVKSLETPLGWITLVEEAGAITALEWGRQEGEDTDGGKFVFHVLACRLLGLHFCKGSIGGGVR